MNVHATPGLPCSFEAPGDPGGVRNLRTEGDLRWEAEHAVGDAPAVGMAPPVADDLLEELVAERGHAEELAVVGGEPVVGEVERPHDADDRGFLPGERRDRGDAALALEVPEPLGRPPGEQHVLHEVTGELGVGFGDAAVGRRRGYRSKFGHRSRGAPAALPRRSLPTVRATGACAVARRKNDRNFAGTICSLGRRVPTWLALGGREC